MGSAGDEEVGASWSTRYLNDERSLAAAIRYVVEEQGDPIALYRAPFLK